MKYGFGKLKREEQLIISLLNSEYGKAEELIKEIPDNGFGPFFDLLINHGIGPHILSRTLDRFSQLLTDYVIKMFRLFVLREITINKLHRNELIKVSGLLSSAGYDITLMKGLSYDPSGHTTRSYGDVDLLVEEDKILEIISFMQVNGYSYKGSFILSREEKKNIEGQLSWNNQYQFSSPHSPETIEIHTNLFERDRIRLENLTTLLDRPDLYKKGRVWSEELKCHVPSSEAALLLLCLHCSLKRSLSNNRFILRHMTDMEILFNRGIKGDDFIALSRDSGTSYHAAFAISLYTIIMKVPFPKWYGQLTEFLTRGEQFLLKRHLRCLKNLRNSSDIGRFVFNFTAPFIIGGSLKQRYTWIRNNFFATKVEQENRYYHLGFKKESASIYFTYFLNPFQSLWRWMKRLSNIKDNSGPVS